MNDFILIEDKLHKQILVNYKDIRAVWWSSTEECYILKSLTNTNMSIYTITNPKDIYEQINNAVNSKYNSDRINS